MTVKKKILDGLEVSDSRKSQARSALKFRESAKASDSECSEIDSNNSACPNRGHTHYI